MKTGVWIIVAAMAIMLLSGCGTPGCMTDPLGDINEDGVVDILDFSLMSAAYGCRCQILDRELVCDVCYDIRADLNCDMRIDSDDMDILQANYGAIGCK